MARPAYLRPFVPTGGILLKGPFSLTCPRNVDSLGQCSLVTKVQHTDGAGRLDIGLVDGDGITRVAMSFTFEDIDGLATMVFDKLSDSGYYDGPKE